MSASTPDRPQSLLGQVDGLANPTLIAGWARWEGEEEPVTVVARLDGAEVAQDVANKERPDLMAAGVGPFAFWLTLPAPLSANDLLSKRLQVLAITASGGLRVVPVNQALRPVASSGSRKLAEGTLAEQLGLLGSEHLPELRRLVVPESQAERLLNAAGTALGSDWVLPAFNNRTLPLDQRVAWLPMPVGLVSGDGSAVLGQGGWLFFIGAANWVRDLFPPHTNPEEQADVIGGWATLCYERQTVCIARGIRYAQLIIPEKLSLLPELVPQPLAAPSCALAGLEALLAAPEGLAESYVPALRLLREAGPREVCPRLNSHLTPLGSWVLAEGIAAALGLPPAPRPEFAANGQVFAGDLALRFFGVPLAEELPVASGPGLAAPALVADEPAPSGRHVGQRRAWHNPAAERDETVLVYGNSYADHHGQFGICWWLAQRFRRVHFTWSGEVDWEEVDRLRPQHLVCQTVERFLKELPTA